MVVFACHGIYREIYIAWKIYLKNHIMTKIPGAMKPYS